MKQTYSEDISRTPINGCGSVSISDISGDIELGRLKLGQSRSDVTSESEPSDSMIIHDTSHDRGKQNHNSVTG